MTYFNNPSRGCGSKQPDAFYLESKADLEGEGIFWAWSWALAAPLDGYAIYIDKAQIPPRKSVLVNPAATFVEQELVHYNFVYEPEDLSKVAAYSNLLHQTRNVGVGDHIGRQHYSPYSFAVEVNEHGPSRRVSREMAKTVAELIQEEGPLPFLFVHDRLPVFSSPAKWAVARGIVEDCFPDQIEWEPEGMYSSWLQDHWGQYRLYGQHGAWNNWMVPVLEVLDKVERNWDQHKDREEFRIAKRFFEDVRFAKQPFGLSWLTYITYTLPEHGVDACVEELEDYIPGLNVIDLENPPAEEEE